MNLSGKFLVDETEISRRLDMLVGRHHLDKGLQKFYSRTSSYRKTRDPLILMDTSALLMTISAKLFISRIAPALARRGTKIVIPISVMAELKNLVDRVSSRAASLKAEEMLKFVMSYWRRGIISIYDNEPDGIFADEQFQLLAMKFSRHYTVIVISQDHLLGQDLLTICRLKSVDGRIIRVRKLRDDGSLESVKWAGASYLS